MFALPSENKTVTSEKNMDALLYLPITTFPDKAEFCLYAPAILLKYFFAQQTGLLLASPFLEHIFYAAYRSNVCFTFFFAVNT